MSLEMISEKTMMRKIAAYASEIRILHPYSCYFLTLPCISSIWINLFYWLKSTFFIKYYYIHIYIYTVAIHWNEMEPKYQRNINLKFIIFLYEKKHISDVSVGQQLLRKWLDLQSLVIYKQYSLYFNEM